MKAPVSFTFPPALDPDLSLRTPGFLFWKMTRDQVLNTRVLFAMGGGLPVFRPPSQVELENIHMYSVLIHILMNIYASSVLYLH